MTKYILRIDETYRLNGERKVEEYLDKQEVIDAYNLQRKGFASILVDEGGSKKVLIDDNGRKYVKGSPFYNFPHVPHISILDGKEIETT